MMTDRSTWAEGVWRRTFALLVLVAGLGLTLSGPPTGASERVRLRYGNIKLITALPDWIAEEKGYWREENLDVEVSYFQGAAHNVQAAMAGGIDLGVVGVQPLAIFLQKDLPLVVVADYCIIQVGKPVEGIVVKAESKIRSPKDLKGASIAIAARATGNDVHLRSYLLPSLRIDPQKEIQIIEVPIPKMEGVLKAGSVDAIYTQVPFLAHMAASPEYRVIWTWDPQEWLGRAEQFAVTYARKDFVEKNPAAVRGFLKGRLRGIEYFYDPGNRDDVLRIAERNLGIPVGILAKMNFYEFARDGRVDMAQVEKNAEALKDLGAITKTVDWKKHSNFSFLPGGR